MGPVLEITIWPALFKTKIMKVKKTQRGFSLIEFLDRYKQKCSLQKSSLATEDAIWLGVDVDIEGKGSSRMHLTKKQVKAILPHLQRFVETGSIEINQPKA